MLSSAGSADAFRFRPRRVFQRLGALSGIAYVDNSSATPPVNNPWRRKINISLLISLISAGFTMLSVGLTGATYWQTWFSHRTNLFMIARQDFSSRSGQVTSDQ